MEHPMNGANGPVIKGKGNSGNNMAGRDIIIHPSAPSRPAPWQKIDADFAASHQKLRETDLRNYLEGAPCKWALVVLDKLVHRPILERLLDTVRSQNITVLLGPGAEGKTTLLRQTAYQLSREGWTVYYAAGTDLLPFPDAGADSQRTIFIVDNGPQCADLDRFLKMAEENEWTALTAGRKNEWNRYCGAHRVTKRNITALETEDISEAEAREEAERFSRYLAAQTFIETSAEEIRERFLHNSNGFLYAAMLESVHGKPLEEIAGDILWNIEPPQTENPTIIKAIYCLCVVEMEGKKLPKALYEDLLRSYSLKPKATGRLVEKEVRTAGASVETRHPTIARLFARHIDADYDFEREEVLTEFLRVCMGNNPERDAEDHLANPNTREVIKSVYRAAADCPEAQAAAFALFAERVQPPEDLLLFFLNNARGPRQQSRLCRVFWEKHFANGRLGVYPGFWHKWGKAEEALENIGDTERKFSARWVYRQGTRRASTEPSLWLSWGALEERLGNDGDSPDSPAPNTARWIYQQGTQKAPDAPHIWLTWGALEERLGNVGDSPDSPAPNTARWIYQQGTEKASDASVWLTWGALEERLGNVGGNADSPAPNTARWIYQQGTKKAPSAHQIWMAWSNFELKQPDRLHGFQTEYSPEWLAETGWRKSKNPLLLLNAVCLAITGQEYQKGRDLLSGYAGKGAGYIRKARQRFVSNPDYDPYGVYTLDYGFFVCFKLLDMEQEADAITQALTEADAYMEKLRAQCLETWRQYEVYAPLVKWLEEH